MEVLRYGSRGGEIMLLQLALKRAGRYSFAPDGVFGTRTLNALRRFQTSEGLVPDGAAGPKTFAALEPYLIGSRRVKLSAGDTFYRLARRYGSTAEAAAAANPRLDPSALPVGEEATVPLGFPLVTGETPFYSRLAEYTARGLMLRFPFLKAEPIGPSVSGRPIIALSLGDGDAEVFFNAAHHANEWITSPLVFGFIERYAEAVAKGGDICGFDARELFAKTRLFSVPMVDPDGVDLVTGFLSPASAEYARAARIAEGFPGVPFPDGWKANIAGTDLNLNYPAEWEKAKEIKFSMGVTGPAPRDYVGTAPLSAPESRAVYEFTLAHNFALTVSFHTQGGEIYRKFGDMEPPGSLRIGEELAAASGYMLSDVPYESGFAGYKDWFILNYDRPGFTVEAGRGANPLPLTDLEGLMKENYPLMAAAVGAAAAVDAARLSTRRAAPS